MKIKITSSLIFKIVLILLMLHSSYSYLTTTNEYKDLTFYEIIGQLSFFVLSVVVVIISFFLTIMVLLGGIKLFPDKTININLPQNNKKELDELYRRIGEESVKNNETEVNKLFKELDKLKK